MASDHLTDVSFKIHHPSFEAILGSDPTISLMAQDAAGAASFHEACIYHPPSKSIFITSNHLPLPTGQVNASTSNKFIKISRVYDSDNVSPSSVHIEEVKPESDVVMSNGGVNYKSGLLFCAQGNKVLSPNGLEGLVYIADPNPPYKAEAIISSFYGRPFNSVNDVIVHPEDESIWFTDPCYGWRQGIRPKPSLPNQVYRYDPATQSIRAVADGFHRPNGLCFSPDRKILYVTDTGAIDGAADVPIDLAGPSHIYAFDITYPHSSALPIPGRDKGEPFLTNRRLFSFASGGWPDGIKCDTRGNVYSGTGDGISVWNSSGILIGKILIKGGVANFCFGENGVLYLCNEDKLWKVHLKGEGVKGDLLGL